MKFSPKKKAKMRKIRQKRVRRYCKEMVGYTIHCVEPNYTVLDQAKIDREMYLLCISENGKQFKIFKLYDCVKVVELSPKRVSNLSNCFQNPAYWSDNSQVFINELGYIVDVKDGNNRPVNFVRISIYGGI